MSRALVAFLCAATFAAGLVPSAAPQSWKEDPVVEFHVPEHPPRDIDDAVRRLDLVYQSAVLVYDAFPTGVSAVFSGHGFYRLSRWPGADELLDSIGKSGRNYYAMLLHARGRDPRENRQGLFTLGSNIMRPFGEVGPENKLFEDLYGWAKTKYEAKDFAPDQKREGSWRFVVRPVRLQSKDCLGCHAWGEEGDPAGLLVYAVRLLPGEE